MRTSLSDHALVLELLVAGDGVLLLRQAPLLVDAPVAPDVHQLGVAHMVDVRLDHDPTGVQERDRPLAVEAEEGA